MVLLQSFDRGNLSLDRFTGVLRVEMERGNDPVAFTEFVVSPEGFDEVPERAIVEYLRAAFEGRPKPDLVITTGGPAAAFAQRHRTQLFPDSPVLYASVDHRFVRDGVLSDRETAVAVANDPKAIVAEILKLFPGTENVFVVIGTGALGRFWRSEVESASIAGVRLIWPDGLSYAAMLERAATLPPRSAIYFHSFDVDAESATYSGQRVLADLHERVTTPIFGGQGAELGYGIVGGNLISTDDLGRETAEAALRILEGTSPALIRTPVREPGPHIYDWRELQRWGVAEARLPAGSIVRFREPGVWDRFKWVIIGGGTALAAQTVLITALLFNRIKRRRAEQSLRESEGRFRLLANSAPVMIRMSDESGLASDFNVPWLTFTGRPLSAESGTGWMDSVHPEDVAACVGTLRDALQRRAPFRLEYRLRRAAGDYRWILESGEPRMTPDGGFAGFIGSAIDITDLKTARATLSNLNRRLMEAQEKERTRLARELHDDVCQRITMLALALDRLRSNQPAGVSDAQEQAGHLYEEVRSLGQLVSGISHRLHSSKLEFLGLATAAATFCREASSHHNVPVEFVHDSVPATLPEGVAINLFRVLQEALSNALKHSGAHRCYVSLRGTNDELRLEVRDEGHGFDPAVALAASGLGLVSMHERLKQINGAAVIESRPGAGTRVIATVPLGVRHAPASINE